MEAGSKRSREIRILAEVEKIWIKYDKPKEQGFNLQELSHYFRIWAYPRHDMTNDELETFFDHIDTDNSGSISKLEMTEFLSFMLQHQQDDSIIVQLEGKDSKLSDPSSRLGYITMMKKNTQQRL
jgi:Ca2+-binding EF-hand superfamily protein